VLAQLAAPFFSSVQAKRRDHDITDRADFPICADPRYRDKPWAMNRARPRRGLLCSWAQYSSITQWRGANR